MGIYDTYGKVQLKIGNVSLKTYSIGDPVNISDGIYLGHNGGVVINKGRFVAEFDKMFTKWGDKIFIYDIVKPFNPLNKVIDKVIKNANKKKKKKI